MANKREEFKNIPKYPIGYDKDSVPNAIKRGQLQRETDYQRARRQRTEIKKYGITGSTPSDALKKIKEHSDAKSKALNKKKGKKSESYSGYHKRKTGYDLDDEEITGEV